MFGLGHSENDAIALLKHDHKEVNAMFEQYESSKDTAKPSEKTQLARKICQALTVHATIEEEIFYPTVRRDIPESQDMIGEAAVEHQSLKDIIGRLEAAPASDPLYDSGVKVLSEYVKHHVKEEEGELFPKVRGSKIDLEALGKRMAERKSQLEGSQSSSRKLRRAA